MKIHENDHTLQCVNVGLLKLLGILFQNDLKWESRVVHLVKGANRKFHRLGALKRPCLPDNDLLTVHFSDIRPI